MREDTFELDLEQEELKPNLSPTLPKENAAKYVASGQGSPAAAVLQPVRPHAPRLIAEDPEKRRIVGRAAPKASQGAPAVQAEAAAEQLSPEAALPAPPAPPVFEGAGLAEVGTLRNAQQTDDDDEFSYAFEGGRREEGFHKQVFRPKAMPAHLVSNVKQPLNTEVLAEEEEEEEEEAEDDDDGDEEEEESDRGASEQEEEEEPRRNDPGAGRAAEEEEGEEGAAGGQQSDIASDSRNTRQQQQERDDGEACRSRASEDRSRSGAATLSISPARPSPGTLSPFFPPKGRLDHLGSGNTGLGSGVSGVASGFRSSGSSHVGGGGGAVGVAKAPFMVPGSDGCASAAGGISERSRSGVEDLDIMRLSTSHKQDNKPGSWTTFAVSEGQIDSLVDEAAAAASEQQPGTGAAGGQPALSAMKEVPAEEDLPSYKLMQALHGAGQQGGGSSAVAGFVADHTPHPTSLDALAGLGRVAPGSEAASCSSPTGLKALELRSPQRSREQTALPAITSASIAAASAAAAAAAAAAASNVGVAGVSRDLGRAATGATAATAAATATTVPVSVGKAALEPKGRVSSNTAPAAKPATVEDDWEVANRERQLEVGLGVQASPTGRSGPPLVYHTALVHLMSADTSSVRDSVAATLPPPPGVFARLLCLGPPILRPLLLREQLLQLLSLARLPFNEGDTMHLRLLGAIYAAFTGKTQEPPRYGSHWAELGFQGQDPATDLRGCGMLGLLQLFFLLQWNAEGANKIYQLSHHPVHEFPLAIVSLNVTKWTLQALRSGHLHRAANTQGSIVEAAQTFYAGCMAAFYRTWLAGGKTMAQSGHVLKELEAQALKKPGAMLAVAQELDLPEPPPVTA